MTEKSTWSYPQHLGQTKCVGKDADILEPAYIPGIKVNGRVAIEKLGPFPPIFPQNGKHSLQYAVNYISYQQFHS